MNDHMVKGEALSAARRAILAMRANDEISDDAFQRINEALDWRKMGGAMDKA